MRALWIVLGFERVAICLVWKRGKYVLNVQLQAALDFGCEVTIKRSNTDHKVWREKPTIMATTLWKSDSVADWEAAIEEYEARLQRLTVR